MNHKHKKPELVGFTIAKACYHSESLMISTDDVTYLIKSFSFSTNVLSPGGMKNSSSSRNNSSGDEQCSL